MSLFPSSTAVLAPTFNVSIPPPPPYLPFPKYSVFSHFSLPSFLLFLLLRPFSFLHPLFSYQFYLVSFFVPSIPRLSWPLFSSTCFQRFVFPSLFPSLYLCSFHFLSALPFPCIFLLILIKILPLPSFSRHPLLGSLPSYSSPSFYFPSVFNLFLDPFLPTHRSLPFPSVSITLYRVFSSYFLAPPLSLPLPFLSSIPPFPLPTPSPFTLPPSPLKKKLESRASPKLLLLPA